MQIRTKDIVKLLPSHDNSSPSTAARPVWGGPHGYVSGKVVKTYTHDPKNQTAVVIWSNGNSTSLILGNDLCPLSPDEQLVAEDWQNGNFPLKQDTFALIKRDGKFMFNVVEHNPRHEDDPLQPAYTTIISTDKINHLSDDHLIIQDLVLSHDFTETCCHTFWEAIDCIRKAHTKDPVRTVVPLPLCQYSSIKMAAMTAPSFDCMLLFHLPSNFADFVAASPGK